MTRTAAAAMMAVLGLVARGAVAQTAEEKAEAAFQAGRALLNEGRYPEACAKFEESQREDPASGTLLALAYCQELSGLYASAWANYRAAAEIALREGRRDRYDAATSQFKGLEQRLSRLTINVPPELAGLPGLELTLDGVEVERAKYGTPIPVDGGTHRIEASAPNRNAWSVVVSVESEQDQKTLTVQVLEPLPAPPTGAPRPPPAPARVVVQAQPLRPLPHEDGGGRTLEQTSLVLGVGALAGLATGLTFGVIAKAKNDASNSDGHCDERGCDARGTELRNDALGAARRGACVPKR